MHSKSRPGGPVLGRDRPDMGGGVKIWSVRLPETICSLMRGKFPLNQIC